MCLQKANKNNSDYHFFLIIMKLFWQLLFIFFHISKNKKNIFKAFTGMKII